MKPSSILEIDILEHQIVGVLYSDEVYILSFQSTGNILFKGHLSSVYKWHCTFICKDHKLHLPALSHSQCKS